MKVLLIGYGKINRIIYQHIKDDIVGIIDEEKEYINDTPNLIIDFSHSDYLEKLVYYVDKYRVPTLIGTTGYNLEKMARIKELSKAVPILMTENFSPGISLVKKMIQDNFNNIHTYEKSIIERHDVRKKDSPSGTALMLSKILDTKTISSIRDKQYIGEHDVVFKNQNEIITITHQVLNRELFALGAINTLVWLVNQKPGLYSLEDVE